MVDLVSKKAALVFAAVVAGVRESNKTLVPLSLTFSGYGNYVAQGIGIFSEISC